MKRKALKAAFPYTLPICVGFLFLGISYGFLMRSKGFSFVYPLCTSLFIFDEIELFPAGAVVFLQHGQAVEQMPGVDHQRQ